MCRFGKKPGERTEKDGNAPTNPQVLGSSEEIALKVYKIDKV